MTRENKIIKKKRNALLRAIKNGNRNRHRYRNGTSGKDCPFQVDINGIYGSCDCGGVNYNECLGDI